MENQTLPEQIAHQLRRRILLGQLQPGAAIKERDNAASLGVSRTPMREAIRILAKEGLIQLRPLRSPIVAKPTTKEITDDLEVMAALEALSCELACQNGTDDELTQLGVIHERMLDAAAAGDAIALFEIDMRFHHAIAVAAHNPALVKTHESYQRRLWRTRFMSAKAINDPGQLMRQHGEILRGLQMRNGELSAQEIRNHLLQIVPLVPQLFEPDNEDQNRPVLQHAVQHKP